MANKEEAVFLIKVNTTELKGPSQAYTLRLSHNATFLDLRQQLATKIGRPKDVAFILPAVAVSGYHTGNLNNNERHSNLTSASGLFTSSLSYIPLDTENVSITLKRFHLQHNGREILINARDRRVFARVIHRGEEALTESTKLPTSGYKKDKLSAQSEDILELFDDGRLGPETTQSPQYSLERHFSERHGALEVLVADAGGELPDNDSLNENDKGANVDSNGANGNTKDPVGESSGWAHCSQALFTEISTRCTVHGTVLLSASTGPKSGSANGESSSGWGLFRSSSKTTDASSKNEPKPMWAMTDGDQLFFCANPGGLAVPGGFGGGYATNNHASSNNSSNVASGGAGKGESVWCAYTEPLFALDLDRATEIKVVHSGDVLMGATPSRSAAVPTTKEVPVQIPGDFPAPPKSKNYRLQIISHSGPRGGVEPRAVSHRRATAIVRANTAGVLLPSEPQPKSRAGSFLRSSFAGSNNSSQGASNSNNTSTVNPKPEGGLVLCTLELGPEATGFDLGNWVKALTAGNGYSNFQHSGIDFEMSRVAMAPAMSAVSISLPPPKGSSAKSDQSSKLVPTTVGPQDSVPVSPLVDLMELADAAIATSERTVAAADVSALREAGRGLVGTLAYQPLRSTFKRRVGERLADENLLFWCHAKDFEMTTRRRNNSALEEGGGDSSAMSLDDMLSSPAKPKNDHQGLSVGDPTFEAALVCMAQETVSKYLNKKGVRRIGVAQGAATEAEVRRVSQEVGDTVRATTEARSSSSFTSRGGAAPKPPPPPPKVKKTVKRGPRACSVCTFVNDKPEAIVCELCSNKLPEHVPDSAEASDSAVSMDDMLSGVSATEPAPSFAGFSRENAGVMFLFSGLADSVFRYMESSDDFIEFSSTKNDSYRNLLLAVPAHLRANRRGQANPLSLRLSTCASSHRTSSVSQDPAMSVSGGFSNLDALLEEETHQSMSASMSASVSKPSLTSRGSFFGTSAMNQTTQPGRASGTSLDKTMGSRTMSSRLLGITRNKASKQTDLDLSKKSILEIGHRNNSNLTLAQREQVWIKMREEELLTAVSSEMIRESEDSRTRCFSDPSLMSPYDLRRIVGAMPDGQAWPDLCWSGHHAKALLKGVAREAREAARLEDTSTAGVLMTFRWWREACASALVNSQSRTKQRRASVIGYIPPNWSPSCLKPPANSGAVEEREWVKASLFSHELRRQQDCQNRWRISVSSQAAASVHVAFRHGIGGRGAALSKGSMTRYAQSPELKELVALAGVPGRMILFGAMRCVWRRGDVTKVGSNSSESEEGEGWVASERLNTFASFTANAAKYVCVLSEVYDNVPLTVAVAEGGFAGDVSRGRKESVGSNHRGTRSSMLSFIRARSGRLERVVHLQDLVAVGPSLKPLHALCLTDAQGECCVMLPGFYGPDLASSEAAATSRDVWFNALGRAGGQRLESHKLVRLPFTEGPVKKKGGGAIQRWQSRRFVLDYSALTMRYYDEGNGEMKGSIPLSTIEHVTPGNDAYFTLVSKPAEKVTPKKSRDAKEKKEKGSRLWDLQASNHEEMLDWVSAIEQCLSLWKQDIRAQQAIQSQANKPNALAGNLGRPPSSKNLRSVRGGSNKK